MTRRLYNIAVVTSLVLFVVVMGLWVESGFHAVVVSSGDALGDHIVAIGQETGSVFGAWAHSPGPEAAAFYFHATPHFTMLPSSQSTFIPIWYGFGYMQTPTETVVGIPHWLLAILTLILPVVWLIRRRRKRDPDALPCAKCGYDLRGSPGGACPECGEASSHIEVMG